MPNNADNAGCDLLECKVRTVWLAKRRGSKQSIEGSCMSQFYRINGISNFFFSEYHEKCLKNPRRNAFDGKHDGELAVLLTNHLLSPLVYGNKYLISNDYQKQPSQCPCLNPNLCMENISYGQTGLGKLCIRIVSTYSELYSCVSNLTHVRLSQIK